VQHLSLAIIGSGSGNALVPEDAAQGPVAVIEAGAFGGTFWLDKAGQGLPGGGCADDDYAYSSGSAPA